MGIGNAGFDAVFLAFYQGFRVEDVGNFTGDADRDEARVYHLLAGFDDVGRNAVENLQVLRRVAAQSADSCGNIQAGTACTGHHDAHTVFHKVRRYAGFDGLNRFAQFAGSRSRSEGQRYRLRTSRCRNDVGFHNFNHSFPFCVCHTIMRSFLRKCQERRNN